MKRSLIMLAAAAAVFLSLSNFASAAIVTMDFEGVVGDSEAEFTVVPYTENGITIDSNFMGFTGIFGKDSSGAIDNTNGTAVFGWCNGNFTCDDFEHTVTLTNGFGDFDLVSMEAAVGRSLDLGTGLEVTGFYAGGGSISTFLDISLVYSDFVFGAAWTGLSSVQFKGDCTDTDGFCDSLAIDNVVVNAVPIPPAIWLFGSALAGLGWLRRTR